MANHYPFRMSHKAAKSILEKYGDKPISNLEIAANLAVQYMEKLFPLAESARGMNGEDEPADFATIEYARRSLAHYVLLIPENKKSSGAV